jgi:hypothetical protein
MGARAGSKARAGAGGASTRGAGAGGACTRARARGGGRRLNARGGTRADGAEWTDLCLERGRRRCRLRRDRRRCVDTWEESAQPLAGSTSPGLYHAFIYMTETMLHIVLDQQREYFTSQPPLTNGMDTEAEVNDINRRSDGMQETIY